MPCAYRVKIMRALLKEFRNPTDEEALAGLEEEEPEDKMSPAPTPKAVAAYPVPDGNPAGPHGLGLTVVDDEE